jgi:hypothetical protein
VTSLEWQVEPWLLHDFPADFYGEELRLVVNAYIRPEATFTTLENLVRPHVVVGARIGTPEGIRTRAALLIRSFH